MRAGKAQRMISKEIGKELNRETREFTRLGDNDNIIRETLLAVYTALVEKGYNPISQIVGYILSEDPTYITNHKTHARSLHALTATSCLRRWSNITSEYKAPYVRY